MQSLRLLLAASLLAAPLTAPAAEEADRAAIAALGEAYVTAFNQGDAKAVAQFWTPDGDYLDLDGQRTAGRAALQDLFAGFFAAHPGAQVRIDSESLRFPAPGLAIEDGTSSVLPKSGPPSRARYTNTFVQQDGKWLLATVRESPFVAPDRSRELGPLGWLLGDWQSTTPLGEKVLLSAAVGPNGNFLHLRHTVLASDTPVSGGLEWIGWDPAAKTIRSWSFNDDGGYAESTWTPDGKAWIVKSTHTLRNGSRLVEEQRIAFDGKAAAITTLSSTLNGDKLPVADPITFQRATDR